MARQHTEMVLFAGNSHPQLANGVASRLDQRLGLCSLYHTSNRESVLALGDSVRGRDVYLIQTGGRDVNNNIMELLIMAYTCKTSAAKNIIGVIPYLPLINIKILVFQTNSRKAFTTYPWRTSGPLHSCFNTSRNPYPTTGTL